MSEDRLWMETEKQTPITREVDVLVVGGGPAGVSAAVGAARTGVSVLLIEANGFLGGMWTAGMVLTLAGFNSWLRPYPRCVRGVGGDWLERATSLGGAEDNEGFVLNSDPEIMKLIADELVIESGAELLLHTWVADVMMTEGRVIGAIIENVEGRSAVRADVTVDCTGNGDLIARSGASWEKGQALQPMTMPFRLTYHDTEEEDRTMPATIPIGPDAIILGEPLLSEKSSRREPPGIDRPAMREAHQRGELPNFGGPWFGGLEGWIMWVNATRIKGDASDASDLTRAEVEGRQDVKALVDYFREQVPGFEETRLINTSTVVGVRETRRLAGRYVMEGSDVRDPGEIGDSIAVGCWPIDVHPSDGKVGVHEMYVPLPYPIPYRSLLPREVDGLITAGRCISTTREALGSTRVGATCAAIGHGAGVAAATSVSYQVPVADVPIKRVHEQLTDQGAIYEPSSVG